MTTISKPSQLCTLLLAACIASGAAKAASSTCTLGELTRTVDVVYANPGQAVPCEVIYAKSDQAEAQTLWRARSQAGYCEEQAAGLIAKLEGLGWNCTTAAAERPATVTEPTEPP